MNMSRTYKSLSLPAHVTQGAMIRNTTSQMIKEARPFSSEKRIAVPARIQSAIV